MSTSPCEFCNDPVSDVAEYCPHCSQPRRFPNVRLAERPENRNALQFRYDQAVANAKSRGCDAVRQEFEKAVSSSRAVLAATIDKLQPIANGQVDLFSTFYDLNRKRVSARNSKASEPDWDKLRPVVESGLFGDQGKDEVIHAALTLSDRSRRWHSPYVGRLRKSHSAHRLSAFEENSIGFFIKKNVTVADTEAAIRGYRSSWKDRHLLAVAKLESKLHSAMTPAEFPGILLKEGASGADDEFIELHLFGPMTLKTVEKLTVVRTRNGRPGTAKLKALKERVIAAGAGYAEVPL